MKKRSFFQPMLVVGMCCAAFAGGWVGYRHNHQAEGRSSANTDTLSSKLINPPLIESIEQLDSGVTKKPKLVAFQLQSTPEMMNFRPGDRVDILTSIKRRDIPLVYDATVLQSNGTSCMFLVPLSESKAVSQAIAEGKNIKLVPSSVATINDSYRPA